MRRYKFLEKDDVFDALNKLRNAFLAAKNGEEVEEIIKGLLTFDERMKIGRRILIAEYISAGINLDEIARILKVGRNTISHVSKTMDEHPNTFQLIRKRSEAIEKEYKNKRYKLTGGSTLVFKRKEYTGFSRKDVKRK